MSLPHTHYESNLVHGEMRRERSMQAYENLRQRLVRRLRRATSGAIEARPQPSVPGNMNRNWPPAFSK